MNSMNSMTQTIFVTGVVALVAALAETGCSAGADGAERAVPDADGAAVRQHEALAIRRDSAQRDFEEGVDELASDGDAAVPGGQATLDELRATVARDRADDGSEDDGSGGEEAPPQHRFAWAHPHFDIHGHRHLCHILKKYMGNRYSHALFVVGGEVAAGPVAQIVGGSDQAFDLWNHQFASFGYVGGGLATAISAGGEVYAGFGFGVNPNVIASWGGEFRTVGLSGSFPAPAAFAGPAISYTWSNPAGTNGWFVGIGAAISLPTPLPVELSYQDAKWFPWNRGTEMKFREDRFFHIPAHVETTTFETSRRPAEYVQYEGETNRRAGGATARAVLALTGPIGIPAAIAAVAIGSLQDQHLDAQDACN